MALVADCGQVHPGSLLLNFNSLKLCVVEVTSIGLVLDFGGLNVMSETAEVIF